MKGVGCNRKQRGTKELKLEPEEQQSPAWSGGDPGWLDSIPGSYRVLQGVRGTGHCKEHRAPREVRGAGHHEGCRV